MAKAKMIERNAFMVIKVSLMTPRLRLSDVAAMRVGNPDSSQFRRQNVTCVPLIFSAIRLHKKNFYVLAV
jgi:hypothetical protein